MPSTNDTSAMQFHLFIFSLFVLVPGVYSFTDTCSRGQGVQDISASYYGSAYTTSLQYVYAAAELVPYMPYENTHINCAIQCAKHSRPWFWTNGQNTNVDCHCIRVTWLVDVNTNTPTSNFGSWHFFSDKICTAGSSGCTQKHFYRVTFNCINCPSGGYYMSPSFGSGGGASFYYPAMSNGHHASGMMNSVSWNTDTQSEFQTAAANNNYYCYHCGSSNLYASGRLQCNVFSSSWKSTCAPARGLTFTNEVYMYDRSKDSDGTCTAKNICSNGYINEGSGFEYEGYYSYYSCVGCPKGTAVIHSDNTAARTTTQCPTCAWGKYSSSTGWNTCNNWRSCYNGQYLTHEDHSYNYYEEQGVCKNCAIGKYRDTGYSNDPSTVHLQSNSNVCQWCPHGTYTTSTGTTTCSNWVSCGNGQYISGASSSAYGSCANCGAGTYKAGTSTTVTYCTGCPSYTYSFGGATACNDWISCGNGQYISGASSSSYGSCANCGAGTYKAGTSTQITSCSTCAAATYATGGATACTPWTECNAGSYNTINSLNQDSTCGLCGAGTFTGTSNRLTSCETCASGTFTTAQGSTECQAWTVTTCPEGQEVLDGTASTDSYCNDCVAGKAKAGTNGDACSPCGADSFSTGGGSSLYALEDLFKGRKLRSRKCHSRRYLHSHVLLENFRATMEARPPRAAPCRARDTFSAEGADACTPWKTCDAGEFYTAGNATADATCTPCPAAEYQPDSTSTATSCLPCSTTNEYSTGGAASCTSTLASCDKGDRFVDGLAVAENQCIACDPGYAQPDDSTRVAQCTPCPAGEFQDQSGADSCDDCPAGTYTSSGATTLCTTKTVCVAPEYIIGTDGGLVADDDCACSSGYNVDTDSYAWQTPEGEVRVSTPTGNYQISPSVAYFVDGKYVIVWADETWQSSSRGIHAQIFNSDGTKNGGEIDVHSSSHPMIKDHRQ